MFKNMHNVRVFARNNGSRSGFIIYLDFSGVERVLAAHKHNALLFGYLKDGVRIEELVRSVRRNNRSPASQKLRASIRHLLKAAEEYILYEYEPPVLQRSYDSSEETERCVCSRLLDIQREREDA